MFSKAVLSRNTKVGRNCIIGSSAHLANYILNNNIRVGVGALMIGNKKDLTLAVVGNNSIIHVGSVVTDDIPDNYIRTFTNKTLPRINHADS